MPQKAKTEKPSKRKRKYNVWVTLQLGAQASIMARSAEDARAKIQHVIDEAWDIDEVAEWHTPEPHEIEVGSAELKHKRRRK